MKKLTVVMVISLILFVLSGCGSKQDPLVGKWVEDVEDGEVIELFSDRTGVVSNSSEQYAITSWLGENGRLKVTIQIPLLGEYAVVYDYEVTSNTLTLSEGDDVTVYNKQN